jgi:hypothetical protein
MTVREFLWKRVKAAMVVQAITVAFAVILAFTLPEMVHLHVAIILVLAGLAAVLTILYRTRCPSCSYPIAMNAPVNLRAGAGMQRINYCPHCGVSIDVAHGSDNSLPSRRP